MVALWKRNGCGLYIGRPVTAIAVKSRISQVLLTFLSLTPGSHSWVEGVQRDTPTLLMDVEDVLHGSVLMIADVWRKPRLGTLEGCSRSRFAGTKPSI